MIEKISIKPKYKRENGLWLLDVADLNLPAGFIAKESNLVYIPPGEFAGNHKHPRTEAFIGIGTDLYLTWQDESGTHIEQMLPEPNLALFVVHSLTPHVVVNKGSGFAILLEFADDFQHDVEAVNLISEPV